MTSRWALVSCSKQFAHLATELVALDLLLRPRGWILAQILLCAFLQHRIEADRRTPFAGAMMHACGIGHNAIEPGGKWTSQVEPRQRAIGSQKRLLHEVFCERLAAS